MLIVAKAALGLSAMAAAAGVFVFHQGVIRVDVDEHRNGGSHMHFWVPATVISTGMHFLPNEHLRQTAEQVRPYLPVLREVSRELQKVPEAELVDVTSGADHVRIAVSSGRLQIDSVSEDGDVVHVSMPAEVLSDVADQLEAQTPRV